MSDSYPLADAYRRGYLAGRAADNPFAQSTEAHGAFLLGLQDRHAGRPARPAALTVRRLRGHRFGTLYAFRGDGGIHWIAGGRVVTHADAGDLFAGAELPAAHDMKGSLL